MRFSTKLNAFIGTYRFWFAVAIFIGLLTRLLNIESVPPSLYWDEAAIVYDAYSLSLTGKDMHGRSWLQPIFYSYGDYKAPVYIWLAGTSVTLFGPTVAAVRLPSVLAGTLLIGVVARLALLLTKDKKLALNAAFLTALLPWSIQFSRAGFEANLGCLLLTLCILLLFEARLKPLYFLLASAAGTLAIYSYFSSRLVLPLLVIAVLIYEMKHYTKQHFRWLTLGIITFLTLTYPLFNSPAYHASNQFRLSNDNLLINDQFVLEQNKARELSGNNWISRALYHRYWFFVRGLLENMAQHLTFSYLFVTGDINLRHSTGNSGVLLLSWLPFLVLGLAYLVKHSLKLGILLLLWWLIALVPAALVFEVPHSLRSLNALVAVVLITAAGLRRWQKIQTRRWIQLITSIVLVFHFAVYYHDYQKHYPVSAAEAWQDGYITLAKTLKLREASYSQITIDLFDRYWLYHLYFQRIPPNDAQSLVNKLGIGELKNKYVFKPFDSQNFTNAPTNTLFVISPQVYENLNEGFVNTIDIITNKSGKPVFYLVTRAELYANQTR